jgi:hypothetical protein
LQELGGQFRGVDVTVRDRLRDLGGDQIKGGLSVFEALGELGQGHDDGNRSERELLASVETRSRRASALGS